MCSHCIGYQMLWWGMDETVAELFARHPQASNFEGNVMSAFRAEIGVNEYGRTKRQVRSGCMGGGTQ